MKQTEQTPIVHSGGYYVSIAGRREVHTYISTLPARETHDKWYDYEIRIHRKR